MAYDKVVDSQALDAIFTEIANAIRSKNGASVLYAPEDMPAAIRAISGGAGGGTQMYTITRNLTNITASNATASVAKGSAYSVTLTPESGCEMSGVTVTMGGVDITSSAYTASTGAVSIASVSGNIVITASATAISEPETTFTINAPHVSINAPMETATPGSSRIFTAQEGYRITSFTLDANGDVNTATIDASGNVAYTDGIKGRVTISHNGIMWNSIKAEELQGTIVITITTEATGGAAYSVTITKPSGMESVVETEFLSGGASMEAGEQLSLRVTSRQAGYLLSLTPAATMGGQEIDLTSCITYDASVDGMAKQYTISNLPVTGDFALTIGAGKNDTYLFLPECVNGTCSGADFRQPGGSIRLTYAHESGYEIPGEIGFTNDALSFVDFNTGEAISKDSLQGRVSLNYDAANQKAYVQMHSLPAQDVIARIEFSPIGG